MLEAELDNDFDSNDGYDQNSDPVATLSHTNRLSCVNITDNYESFDQTPSFQLEITDPRKVGDVLHSHIVYNITFKGYKPYFDECSSIVSRRFSDFDMLHKKLVDRYLSKGIVIPPLPDKNVLGSTKSKFSQDATTDIFIERRRKSLTRFLNRILNHPTLNKDEDLMKFLKFEGDLPRSLDTQMISKASAKKLIQNMRRPSSSVVEDPSEYFQQKHSELAHWECQLKLLHSALLSLSESNQKLSSSKLLVSQSLTSLTNLEEHTGLAQSLGRLANIEEQVGQLLSSQSQLEMDCLVECANETLGVINACQNVLSERLRIYREWKSLRASLDTKQNNRTALNQLDHQKASAMDAEISLLNARVDELKEQFDTMSENIKKELDHVDLNRFNQLHSGAKAYLESVLKTQTKVSAV